MAEGSEVHSLQQVDMVALGGAATHIILFSAQVLQKLSRSPNCSYFEIHQQIRRELGSGSRLTNSQALYTLNSKHSTPNLGPLSPIPNPQNAMHRTIADILGGNANPGVGPPPSSSKTAVERRGNNLSRLKGFPLKAQARIWP